MVALTLFLADTLTTVPTTTVGVGIFRGVLMIGWAVGLPGVLCRPACPPQDVHTLWHQFNVMWVAASSVPTEVIALYVRRNRSTLMHPDDSMHKQTLGILPATNGDHSVSLTRVSAARPDPATVRIRTINTPPDPLDNRGHHHTSSTPTLRAAPCQPATPPERFQRWLG